MTSKLEESDDLVDNILDNLTAEKGLEPLDKKRPKTAGVQNLGIEARKESLWSAGAPNNQRTASGSRF